MLSTGSGLYCDDYSAIDNQVTIRVKNILTESVVINYIDLNVTGIQCTEFAPALTITADNTGDILYPCNAVNSGAKVKGDILIVYTPAGGLAKTATGSIVTTAQ